MSDAPKVIWAQQTAVGWEEPHSTIYQVDHFHKYHHADTVTALEAERDQALAREAALKDNTQRCRELQLEVNSLKAQLQDQALSHLATIGQLTDQLDTARDEALEEALDACRERSGLCEQMDDFGGAAVADLCAADVVALMSNPQTGEADT